MNLCNVEIGKDYIIKEILTDDNELNDFLFTLGCYSGEVITVVAHNGSGFTVAIKDARYNIDKELASKIII